MFGSGIIFKVGADTGPFVSSMNALPKEAKKAGDDTANAALKGFKGLKEGLAGLGVMSILTQMRALAEDIRNMPGVPPHVVEGMLQFSRGFDDMANSAKVALSSIITNLGDVGMAVRKFFDASFEAELQALRIQEERAKQLESDHVKGMARAKEIGELRERNISAEIKAQELLQRVALESMVEKARAQDEADEKTRERAARIKGALATEAQLREVLSQIINGITTAELEIKKTKEGTIEHDRLLVQIAEARLGMAEIEEAITKAKKVDLVEIVRLNYLAMGYTTEETQVLMVKAGLVKNELNDQRDITGEKEKQLELTKRMSFSTSTGESPFEMSDEELSEKLLNLQRAAPSQRAADKDISTPAYQQRAGTNFIDAQIDVIREEQQQRSRFRRLYSGGTAQSFFGANDFQRFEQQYINNGGSEGQKILDELKKVNNNLQDRMPVSNVNQTNF